MLILLCLEKSNNPIPRHEFADRVNHYFAASQAYANEVGKAIESFRKRLEEAMQYSEYGMRPIPRFNRMKARDISEYFAISRWCDGSLDVDIASELGHRFSIRGVERFQAFFKFDVGERQRHASELSISELEMKGLSYREFTDEDMHQGYFTDRFLLVPRFYGANALPHGTELLVDYDRKCSIQCNANDIAASHKRRIQRYNDQNEEEDRHSGKPIPLAYLEGIQSKFEVPEPGQRHHYCAVCRVEFTEGHFHEHIAGEAHRECVNAPSEKILYDNIDDIISGLDTKVQNSLQSN